MLCDINLFAGLLAGHATAITGRSVASAARAVTSREQAVAIGLSEACKAGAKLPPEQKGS
ncbi:MAG: DUF6496 domain-containing protein [Candidatus Geothermincolia bacterium]